MFFVARAQPGISLKFWGPPPIRVKGKSFNFVPCGDLIENGANNINIVKKNSVISLKKQPYE